MSSPASLIVLGKVVRIFIPAAMLSFVTTAATADLAGPPLTLNDYLERAQTANPDLQAYAARYEAALDRIPQAAALPDPMLQVESMQARTAPQENTLMLSQRIPWFGRLSGRKQATSIEAEASHYAYEARQLDLTRTVGTAFYDYAYTGKALELTAQNLALLEHLVPIVEERSRNGANLNNLLRLQVEIGRLRDTFETLRQKRPQLSARLAALLALPDPETLPWPEWTPADEDKHTAPDHVNLLATVERQNPELRMLERNVASSTTRVELARLETRPDITLGVSYMQMGSPITIDPDRDSWGVSLAVNLPIWHGRTSAARREANANQRSTESELIDRRNQLRADTLIALSTHNDALRRVRLYQSELLPLARQAVKNTASAYEGNRATLLELIDSTRTQLDLELQLWRARADAAQQDIVLQTLANHAR